jgi:hypothetical protein
MSSEIIKKNTVLEMCRHRQRALEEFDKAVVHVQAALAAANRALQNSEGALIRIGSVHRSCVYAEDIKTESFRTNMDEAMWRHLLNTSNLKTVMSRSAIDEFHKGLEQNVPEATEENILATMAKMFSMSGDLFDEMIIQAFKRLPRDYRTNSSFRFTTKIIYDRAFEPGMKLWEARFYSSAYIAGILYDLEKVFRTIDGKPTDPQGQIVPLLCKHVGEGDAPWHIETEYFRCKAYKKGSLHILFLRQDLVDRMNRVLARHYGEALPSDK